MSIFKRIKINEYNSTVLVQCDAKGRCVDRFSRLCDKCQHNTGRKQTKSYFIQR